MKFNEIEKDQWPDLKPYLDTCLLPVTGLRGFEDPSQTTVALEHLRDALETIEIPYRGRVVTYPALHYMTGVDMKEQLQAICLQLKHAGFRYVIVLSIHTEAAEWKTEQTDLLIAVDKQEWTSRSKEIKAHISQQVQQLWLQGD
jgi:23S rRNA (pseudouridine1915-N3)-methyltransferase